MLATEIIARDVPTVNLDATIAEIKEIMNECKLTQLAVVDRTDFVGLISDTDIDDLSDDQNLRPFHNRFLEYMINEKQLVHDAVKIMSEHDLMVVPIVGENREYIGSVTVHEIMDYYGKTLAIENGCSVFVLLMDRNDYSLGEIAQIVEGNDAKIYAVQVFPENKNNQISVVLSIKAHDNGGILQSFNRYDYHVAASYDENTFQDDLKSRFEELMRYINM